MSFRTEQKYRLTKSDLAQLKARLNLTPKALLHPSRQVFSCYFDDGRLSSYHDSEEGVLPRKKVRLRWYNQTDEVRKETKISSIEGRFKATQYFGTKAELDNLGSLKFVDNFYGVLTPTLLVEYWRDYFVLDGCRITVDTDIRYANLRAGPKYEALEAEYVLEVKNDKLVFGSFLQSYLKSSTSRFSKYCKGVSSLKMNTRV